MKLNMNMKELMKLVEDTFEEEVHSELDNFFGDPYSSLIGKNEFLKKLKEELEKKLDNHLFKKCPCCGEKFDGFDCDECGFDTSSGPDF